MITSRDINIVLSELQKLLCGYNYEVLFGVKIFDNCITKEDFQAALKAVFPNARPETVEFVPMTAEDFFTEIEFALDYRGDNGAGVVLSGSKLERFAIFKEAFLNILQEWLNPDSKIFSYPDELGIPGYPVWWDFRFIIFNNKTSVIFIYGAASD